MIQPLVACVFLLAGATLGEDVTLVSFMSSEGPLPVWKEMNDPVMGGRSFGDFTVAEGMGTFDGEVVDVPFLHAPGFIQATTKGPFSDATSCKALVISCRSSVDFEGYKIAFGNRRGGADCGFYSRGYKAPLDAPVGEDFVDVVIPFTEFSNCNDDATGLPVRTCMDDPHVCPNDEILENMVAITVWGEGVAGKVHLEIQEIRATDCSAEERQD